MGQEGWRFEVDILLLPFFEVVDRLSMKLSLFEGLPAVASESPAELPHPHAMYGCLSDTPGSRESYHAG